MIENFMKTQLIDYFFSFERFNTYAVIDGASVAGLMEALTRNKPEYCCLFSGKLSPELVQTAPYLIKLNYKSPIVEWLFDGWGNHYGIYAIIPENLHFNDVRKHFRSFLIVKSPDNKPLFFRYYDPRVLRMILPSSSGKQIHQIFGPTKLYILEGGEENSVLQYWLTTDKIECKKFYYKNCS